MTAPLTPPPPRPVPVEVRRRVASRVLGHIAAEGRRERRPQGHGRRAVWALAALAVVVVLGVAGVLERSWSRTPPAQPAPPPGWSPPRPQITGLSEQDTSRIVSECTDDLAPWGTERPLNKADIGLYNVFGDAYGSVGFVFGSQVALACFAQPGDPTYRNQGFTAAPKGMLAWMTRPVTIDVTVGGPTGTQAHPGPWAETFAGRVVPEATRVVFRAFGRSMELPVTNQTYVGRMVFQEPANTAADYEVTAYDAAGRVIATTTWRPTCAVTPDGVVINPQVGIDCPAAVAWR